MYHEGGWIQWKAQLFGAETSLILKQVAPSQEWEVVMNLPDHGRFFGCANLLRFGALGVQKKEQLLLSLDMI